ncbi:VOC family protein [Crenalkalicoccus roseus]|uniref:VOC family protein n=1 Tax=Crenalkalicoccus roseus TaxID=1485588 RepID=UPI0010813799|nr:VOC family protein [Crenalkalicoccus roseus]
MGLHALNHYTIRTADLERTRDFYVTVLGLEVGHRPPLGFPGYWLYCGGQPTVHLVGPRERDAHLPREAGPTGLLDHIAFTCTGLAEMRERLKRHGVPHEERVVPRDRQTQLFLRDPDGIAVELNFPPEETDAA